MLVDCGTTSVLGLKSLGFDPNSVSAVVISHLHGDHFGGLPFLILDGQFSGRTQPLLVAGPPGTADRLNQTMEALFPGSAGVRRKFDVEVRELVPDGSPQQVGEAAGTRLGGRASQRTAASRTGRAYGVRFGYSG